VYDHDMRQIHTFESALNPKGILVLSPTDDNNILAFPAVQQGHVRIQNLIDSSFKYVRAHDGPIACLGLSRDGRRLATASDKGTVLRVFDTETGQKLTEVRRGTTSQTIHSIAFSNDDRYMACSSSSGTVHLFDISATAPEPSTPATTTTNADQPSAPIANRTSSLSVLSYVGVEYAASKWSMCEFKSVETPALVSFGPSPRQVRVVTFAGTFYDLTFDLATGGVTSKRHVFSHNLEQ
jgi:WD repeat-containing protein 45